MGELEPTPEPILPIEINEATLFARVVIRGYEEGVISEQQLIDLDNMRLDVQFNERGSE